MENKTTIYHSDKIRAEVDERIEKAKQEHLKASREAAIWTIFMLLSAAFFVWVVFK